MVPLLTLKPFITKKQLHFHLHQSWIKCPSAVSGCLQCNRWATISQDFWLIFETILSVRHMKYLKCYRACMQGHLGNAKLKMKKKIMEREIWNWGDKTKRLTWSCYIWEELLLCVSMCNHVSSLNKISLVTYSPLIYCFSMDFKSVTIQKDKQTKQKTLPLICVRSHALKFSTCLIPNVVVTAWLHLLSSSCHPPITSLLQTSSCFPISPLSPIDSFDCGRWRQPVVCHEIIVSSLPPWWVLHPQLLIYLLTARVTCAAIESQPGYTNTERCLYWLRGG